VPPDPAERLLAETSDARACAVSFTGDAIAEAPVLQTDGELFRDLPIPRRDGMAFAGWYPTSEDAAAREQVARVNGADMVACTDRRLALHGAWMPAEDVAALHVGVPILMYHQFTTKPEGERGALRGNFAYIGDFEAHMKHLADTHVYLPTWDELSAFVDGALYIPRMCAIVTDDDADPTWTTLAAPIVAKYGILTTSFTITSAYPGPPPNAYVIQRSHTHDMHSAGDDGRGRMVNWPADRIAADLNASADVLGGTRQVMAYPYGHYNDTAKQGLRQAGFEMARTTEPGYVRAGADKLALPTERISYGMGLNAFVAIVG
jgi:peptidoglycan/xylan/chitin deacetylase (PgdA/CDA1 family)